MDRYTGLELVPGGGRRADGRPLFFADANRFRDALDELISSNQEPVRALVVDATAISQTDTDGADIVIQIAEDLRSRGISLAFAHVEPAILELWTRAGAIEAIGPDRIFETVRGAVRALETGPTATAATTSAREVRSSAPRCAATLACRRFARNCATRNLTPPHAPI